MLRCLMLWLLPENMTHTCACYPSIHFSCWGVSCAFALYGEFQQDLGFVCVLLHRHFCIHFRSFVCVYALLLRSTPTAARSLWSEITEFSPCNPMLWLLFVYFQRLLPMCLADERQKSTILRSVGHCFTCAKLHISKKTNTLKFTVCSIHSNEHSTVMQQKSALVTTGKLLCRCLFKWKIISIDICKNVPALESLECVNTDTE